jgi:potassium-transporting ATPase KdpC subunit
MRALKRALLFFILFSALTGFVYPFFITGLCRLIFPHKANGSLIAANGKTVGSDLIGQNFTGSKYFNGRPSAIEKPYDAGNSGASNLGPSNTKFLEEVGRRVAKVRQENGLSPDAPVPADLVLASGSGLDPHISLDAALIQVLRVANARTLPETQVREAVEKLTESPFLGLTGEKRVNLLRLNLAVDALVTANR